MSITESSSPYQDLEKLALGEVLEGINKEDQKVAQFYKLISILQVSKPRTKTTHTP